MIKSMTGFGRCEIAEADRKFTVEMKGVNHRYLDVNIRMPKKLNFFESAIRNLLKQYVQRCNFCSTTRIRERGAPNRAHSGFSLSEEPGRMVRSMISRSSTA